MNIKENIQSSLTNIRSHKLRSFLTMLGMIIGISAVITILAIGQSAQGLIVSQITGAGTNLIGVLPGKSDEKIDAKTVFVKAVSIALVVAGVALVSLF